VLVDGYEDGYSSIAGTEVREVQELAGHPSTATGASTTRPRPTPPPRRTRAMLLGPRTRLALADAVAVITLKLYPMKDVRPSEGE
jgi:hypothetical protein